MTSKMIEKQQAEMDYYASLARTHSPKSEEFKKLDEAKQRTQQHSHLNYTKSKYKVGDDVSFCDRESHISGRGTITKVILPGEAGNEYHGSASEDINVMYELDSISNNVKGKRGWMKESVIIKTLNGIKEKTVLPISSTKSLHPMDYVGIDTCSAVSVSTEIADFIFVDRSFEAGNSITLNGVGEGGPQILGRGSMVVSTVDENGDQIFMLDPAEVYIKKRAGMRILGQQRMKRLAYKVAQSYSTNKDIPIYRDKVQIPLTMMNGILMVKTEPWNLSAQQKNW